MGKKPGRKPYLTKPTVTASLMLFEEQMDRLDQFAAAHGASRSAVVRDAIEFFLAAHSHFVQSPHRTISPDEAAA